MIWRMMFFFVLSAIMVLRYWTAADPPSTDIFVLWLGALIVIFGILYHKHCAGKRKGQNYK